MALFDHFWANFDYVSHIPAIRFWCHCTYRTLIWCRITVENFVLSFESYGQFVRKSKKVEKWVFFGHFWANFGYVSHIPAIRFWCHCTYRTLIWCKITVENFVRIVWTVFEKSEKNRKMAVFGHFWANFGYVSHIQAIRFWCLCTRRGPFGCRMTVQNFVKIVWTVFEKFEIFMKRSGEKTRAACAVKESA